MDKRIARAQERVEEARERQAEFLRIYRETGNKLYKELADTEQEEIDKIRDAIMEASLLKLSKEE